MSNSTSIFKFEHCVYSKSLTNCLLELSLGLVALVFVFVILFIFLTLLCVRVRNKYKRKENKKPSGFGKYCYKMIILLLILFLDISIFMFYTIYFSFTNPLKESSFVSRRALSLYFQVFPIIIIFLTTNFVLNKAARHNWKANSPYKIICTIYIFGLLAIFSCIFGFVFD